MPSRSSIWYQVFRIKSFAGKNTRYSIPYTRYGESKGFTLIELLVVITLFAIVSTLIVASYTTFERNQRIKNAAQTLKNDLRLVQNKALAGDKGISNVSGGDCTDLNKCCPNIYLNNNYSLVGWYVTFDTAQTSTYTYTGVCKNDTTKAETPFSSKTVSYPTGVTFTSMRVGAGSAESGIRRVLFRPLSTSISLHKDSDPDGSPKDFIDSSGNLINTVLLSGDITIDLEAPQTSTDYKVVIRPSGEISEIKI